VALRMMASQGGIVALVPARGGSKGLPGKCVRPLHGVPLYQHAVNHALAAGIGRVVISTDIDSILDSPAQTGVSPVRRPAALAQDATPMIDVLLHHLDTGDLGDGLVVLLQPTSPLRTPADIDAGLSRFRDGGYDLVMSVCEGDRSVLKWGMAHGGRFQSLNDPAYTFANRQSLPAVVRPNGAVYVIDSGWLRHHRRLDGGRTGCFLMPAGRSHDIDTQADFDRCTDLLAKS